MIVAVWCENMQSAMNTMRDCPISSKFVMQLIEDTETRNARRGIFVLYRVTDDQSNMIHRFGVQQKPAWYMLFEGDKR